MRTEERRYYFHGFFPAIVMGMWIHCRKKRRKYGNIRCKMPQRWEHPPPSHTHTHIPVFTCSAQVGEHEEHKADWKEFNHEFLIQKVTTVSIRQRERFSQVKCWKPPRTGVLHWKANECVRSFSDQGSGTTTASFMFPTPRGPFTGNKRLTSLIQSVHKWLMTSETSERQG